MPDYKSMYLRLAWKVADAIELLTQAQLETEDMAMEEARPGLALTPGGSAPSDEDEAETKKDE
mgnify:CR=1 FL=1